MNEAQVCFEDIKIGAVYEFGRTITEDDERLFAKLSGDATKLKADAVLGDRSGAGKRVAHGMLAASLLSVLIDVYAFGPKSLYLRQTLEFRKPIFYGDRVIVRGTVLDKSDAIGVVTLMTEILKRNKVVISGEAKVKV